jgi:hypothetical protein
MTHDEHLKAAADRFTLEPEALTQDDLDVLTRVDDHLGERAAKRRRDTLTKAAEARHRAALGQPPAATDDADVLADACLDVIVLHLAKPKSRIKALEAQNETLEQKYNALELRLLELEAKFAVQHVDR